MEEIKIAQLLLVRHDQWSWTVLGEIRQCPMYQPVCVVTVLEREKERAAERAGKREQ